MCVFIQISASSVFVIQLTICHCRSRSSFGSAQASSQGLNHKCPIMLLRCGAFMRTIHLTHSRISMNSMYIYLSIWNRFLNIRRAYLHVARSFAIWNQTKRFRMLSMTKDTISVALQTFCDRYTTGNYSVTNSRYGQLRALTHYGLGPLLLTWFNFNRSMDK